MNPLRIVLAGARGRMGQLCRAGLEGQGDLQVVALLERDDDPEPWCDPARADVLLDFTWIEASRLLAPRAAERGMAPVVGTSGWTAEDTSRLAEACARGGVGGLLVPNFSLGAVLQMRHAAELARWLPCRGIREVHHPAKRDAPSGTARATAAAIGRVTGIEPSIHSERTEGVLAVQEVAFGGSPEEVLLRHEVRDRGAYLPGILLALRRVRTLERLEVGLDVLLREPPRPASGAAVGTTGHPGR